MTYAKRLLKAIAHSQRTQAEIAERAGTTQQVVSAIIRRGSTRSTYTAQLAKACGVSPDWLATGKGTMLTEAREPATPYALTPEARELAVAWDKLSPPLQSAVRTLVFSMASAQTVARWLVIEPPKSDGYAAWEDAIQRAYNDEIKQLKLDLDSR